MVSRDDADRGIADVGQQIVIGDVAGGDQLDARLVEAALGELLHEGGARARGDEDEHRVGRIVLDALQEGREIGVLQRHADLLHHRAATLGEHVAEPLLRVAAGAVIGHQRDDLVDVVLEAPLRHRHRGLRQREGGAHDIERLFRDHRGRRGGDDLGNLGLGGDWRDRERQRGEAEAHQRLGVVVADQLLGEALGDVGRASVVLDDERDLLSRHRVAVHLDIELGSRLFLLAGARLLAGHRQNQPDRHDIVRPCRRGEDTNGGGQAGAQTNPLHPTIPPMPSPLPAVSPADLS